MLKNMNWGKWVALFFTTYVVFLLIMLFYSFSLDINLVEEDYYAKDLSYQEQIERIERTKDLKESITNIFYKKNNLYRVIFPNMDSPDKYSGKILLFRPSDAKMDFSMPIKLDSSYIMNINTSKMAAGFWRIKIAWQINDDKYYNEDSFEK